MSFQAQIVELVRHWSNAQEEGTETFVEGHTAIDELQGFAVGWLSEWTLSSSRALVYMRH